MLSPCKPLSPTMLLLRQCIQVPVPEFGLSQAISCLPFGFLVSVLPSLGLYTRRPARIDEVTSETLSTPVQSKKESLTPTQMASLHHDDNATKVNQSLVKVNKEISECIH